MKVFLISSSPRRKEIFKLIGCPLEVINPTSDESSISKSIPPQDYVREAARLKAGNIGDYKKSGLYISADTIVYLNDKILTKPRDDEEALNMLNELSDNWHKVYTGLFLYQIPSNIQEGLVEITDVRFRELSPYFIKRYINTGEPRDKAGAYGIQGFGASLIKEIKGCYFNVMGFPLGSFLNWCDEMGIFLPLFERKI